VVSIDRLEKVASVIKNIEAKSTLDIGCKNKELKKYLPNFKYLGIDISPAADIKLNLNKVNKLPLKSNSFDVVVLSAILEHLFYPQMILKEAIRISKKYLIISLPNDFAYALRLNYLLGRSHLTYQEFGHKGVMSIDQMESFLQLDKNKISIIDRWYEPPLLRIFGVYLPKGFVQFFANIYPKLFANEVFFLCEK